jgi:hypothetical protein
MAILKHNKFFEIFCSYIIGLYCIYVDGQHKVHICNVVKKQNRKDIHTQNKHQLKHQENHFATKASNSAKSQKLCPYTKAVHLFKDKFNDCSFFGETSNMLYKLAMHAWGLLFNKAKVCEET